MIACRRAARSLSSRHQAYEQRKQKEAYCLVITAWLFFLMLSLPSLAMWNKTIIFSNITPFDLVISGKSQYNNAMGQLKQLLIVIAMNWIEHGQFSSKFQWNNFSRFFVISVSPKVKYSFTSRSRFVLETLASPRALDENADTTSQPTSQLTMGPIRNPTFKPSTDPTHATKRLPSFPLTENYTYNPSSSLMDPSASPTSPHIVQPTKAPSELPSNTPIETSSLKPTLAPTYVPISKTSYRPSRSSSMLPTSSPTEGPSSKPSHRPTKMVSQC